MAIVSVPGVLSLVLPREAPQPDPADAFPSPTDTQEPGSAAAEACPAPPLVAVSPQDSRDIDEIIRRCANRFTRLKQAFEELKRDLETRARENGGSLEDVLNLNQPVYPGGPTVRQRAEELMEEVKQVIRNFDGTPCPSLISPEARNAYYDLKNQVNQLDRQLKGAGGMNIDLGGTLEGLGRALSTFLGIMRRLDPSYAH